MPSIDINTIGTSTNAQPSVYDVVLRATRIDITAAGTTQELTIKYYQRVYDAGTAGYCYYTMTSIDASPAAEDTSPEYTGVISGHSVVKILEIY